MLEDRGDACGGKKRNDRQSQRRARRERGRRGYNRGSGCRFAMAGSKESHHAKVTRSSGVRMKLLVQRGRCAQQSRGDERKGKQSAEADFA